MESDEYRVIITGELVGDFDKSSVVVQLAKILKQPADILMRLFGQHPLPLKAIYTLPEAKKIQRYLYRIGVVTRLEADDHDVVPAGIDEATALSDVELFVGQKSGKYLKQFRNFNDGSGHGFTATWHWPAMLVPFYWAIYRKLWGWSVVILLSTVMWPLSNVLWAITANYLYFRHVNKRLSQLREKHLVTGNRQLMKRIRRAGGTSALGLGVAIILPAAMGAVAAKAIVDEMREEEVALQQQKDMALVREKEVFLHRDVDMAKDQIPALIVKSAPGQKTYLNMNVLIAGMQMAIAGQQKAIIPGMGREQLAKAMNLQPALFTDGWDKSLSVWIGYEGFSLHSAGPDGEYGNKDDMLMQRKWKMAITDNKNDLQE